MVKTLEIIQDDPFIVRPQGWDEEYECDAYTLDVGDRQILNEAGIQTVNINEDKHFHIEQDGSHVRVTVEDEPQGGIVVGIPYSDDYTFSEKVSECGVPNTDEAENAFRYCPYIRLLFEYEAGETEIDGIEVNGTQYDLVER